MATRGRPLGGRPKAAAKTVPQPKTCLVNSVPRGASLSLLAEGPVVLLDRRPEAGRHFVGTRQRQRLVLVAVRLLTQAELPVLQLLERCRLQRRQAPRIGE